MIYLKCECGNGLGVPGSFLGESIPCDDCGRSLRLVAGREIESGTGVRWRLQVRSGPPGVSAGEQILLGGDVPIDAGTADGKPLLLRGGHLVSRQHCRFVPTDDGWQLEDTNSRNGVYVNGARVARHNLQAGDVVRIGEYELQYLPAGPVPKAAPAHLAPAGMPPSAPPARTAVAANPSPPPASPQAYDTGDAPDAEYDLAEPAPAPPPRPRPDPIVMAGRAPAGVNYAAQLGPGPKCPCCSKQLAGGARLCVECGIDVKTGRPLLTAQGLDEDTLHVRAENTIWFISWLIWFGLYPVASEARGNSKPYAVWSIGALTVLASFVFFGFEWNTPDYQLAAGSNLMLWAGEQRGEGESALPEEDQLELETEIHQLQQQPDRQSRRLARQLEELLAMTARPTLEFQPHQLVTHALLHGDLFHIAGNMLFLLVLGTRVNALLGNLMTAILYPILAIAGGVGHLIASQDQPATPMLGASGAIMGLAGMYLVLLPAYRVHMVIWARLGLLTGFRLMWKLFAVRGFWVVLFYIAFDVIATLLGSEDGVAHWAHLGGFIAGGLVALLLLLTRMIDAHGGDLLSVVLGKYAWPLLGRPGQRARKPAPALAAPAA